MATNQDRLTALSFSSVLFYLLLVPLTFAGSLHYMECKNKSLEFGQSSKIRADMSTIKNLIANSQEIRKHLIFYDAANKYTVISVSNEVFNYSLPLLGQREFNLIKGKEENLFKSAEETLFAVGEI